MSRLKRKRISEAVAQGKREDGRGLTDLRAIKIRKGIFEKAEGSAELYLGNTRVVVGVKVEKGEPFADTPNQAVLTVNSEFTPLASPTFEPGPPDETSIELARVVDRGIRSCEAINLEKYVIKPGKLVHVIFIDIWILNQDGNLIDASAMASLAALMNTRMPRYSVEGDELRFVEGNDPLELRDFPVAVSVGKVGNEFLVDMTADEEDMMETRLTVTTNKDGHICALQKSGSEGLTLEEIKKAISLASEKGNEIRKLVMGS